jgi:DNA-binding response OmpR family regulator
MDVIIFLNSLSCNVLLVDDDKLLLETYSTIIISEGYTVFSVTNPYEALQIIQKQEINLVILDYNLPYMTGTQLGHLINKAQKDVKIMFVSGNPKIKELVNNVDYCVYEVFCKPINIEQFLIRVKAITDSDCEPLIKPKKSITLSITNS